MGPRVSLEAVAREALCGLEARRRYMVGRMRTSSRDDRASVLLTLGAVLLLSAGGCTTTTTVDDGILRGRVVALADGDTITVLDAGKKQEKIRLSGIDAPERHQAFGSRSTEHLSALVFQKEVEVHWKKRDRYGRILGKVMVDDPACGKGACPKIDANLRQVSAGLAWWYRQYAKEQEPEDRRLYEEAERRSKVDGIGLWAEPDPVAPWNFRRSRSRKKAPAKSTGARAPTGTMELPTTP